MAISSQEGRLVLISIVNSGWKPETQFKFNPIPPLRSLTTNLPLKMMGPEDDPASYSGPFITCQGRLLLKLPGGVCRNTTWPRWSNSPQMTLCFRKFEVWGQDGLFYQLDPAMSSRQTMQFAKAVWLKTTSPFRPDVLPKLITLIASRWSSPEITWSSCCFCVF